MIDFNLNNYILVQITEYGWDYLRMETSPEYIKHSIFPYITIIDGEEWYKLQGHQIIELFGNAIFIASKSPIKPNIKILKD